MVEISTKVTITGPLFTGRSSHALRQANDETIKELMVEGESFLFDRLRPAPSGVFKSVQAAGQNASTGNYRRNIQSSPVRNLSGTLSDGGVIYGSWLEGTSSRNSSTPFKGYASFRKAKDHIDKKTEEVANKNLNKFVRKMNS